MKKVVCLTFIIALVATSSFAANLADVLTSTKLSNQVIGTYFSNNNAGDDATSYVLSTGHTQGNKVYASGNFVSEIYVKDSSEPFVSGDLISSDPGTYDSAIFGDYTAL